MREFLTIFLLTSFQLLAQESTNSSGGDVNGIGGSVAYSIGQVAYSNLAGTNGNENQGVQQPYEIYTLELESLESLDIILFPNPVINEIAVKLKEVSNYPLTFNLIDINGSLLSSIKSNDQDVKLDMSSLSSGHYLLNILDDNKLIKSFKIVKN